MPDSATPLLCRRPELVLGPSGDSGSYLVRNRQKGESFQLNPEAYFLLARLDGMRTAPEICAAFTERFGVPLAEVDLQRFLDMARASGFLQADGEPGRIPAQPGHATEAYSPRRSRRVKHAAAWLLTAVAGALQWVDGLLSEVIEKIYWVRLAHLQFVPRPDDIFIVTYPRSGTTWLQMVLYQLTTDGNMDFPHIFEYCPSFEKSIRSIGGFEGRPSPRLFKSHLPYHRIPKGPCKYIYVARNGADVAVSFFHLYQSHYGYRGTFEEFFDLFMRGKVDRGSWFQHVRDWWRHRNDPNVLFLRYEDLLDDLEGCLRRVIDFCGFDIAPERIPTLLERCGLPFMKRHESQFDVLTGMLWEQGRQLGAFIRNGRAGEGKERLTPEQAARFDKAFREHLGPLGIDFGTNGRKAP